MNKQLCAGSFFITALLIIGVSNSLLGMDGALEKLKRLSLQISKNSGPKPFKITPDSRRNSKSLEDLQKNSDATFATLQRANSAPHLGTLGFTFANIQYALMNPDKKHAKEIIAKNDDFYRRTLESDLVINYYWDEVNGLIDCFNALPSYITKHKIINIDKDFDYMIVMGRLKNCNTIFDTLAKNAPQKYATQDTWAGIFDTMKQINYVAERVDYKK